MSNPKELRRPVVLGQVVKAHGLKGGLRVASWAESVESYSRFKEVWLRPKGGVVRRLALEWARPHPKGVILKLAGIDFRDQAEELVGAEIVVPRDALPETEAGEYYWVDLIGLRVQLADGTELGVIKALFETGANDVLVVDTPEGEVYVPAVESAVLEVDLAGGVMVIRALEEE